MDDDLAVSAGSNGRPAIEFDGSGQYEPFVIVGVFADKVDATRGAINVRRGPEAGLESVQKLQRCLQCRVLSQICII